MTPRTQVSVVAGIAILAAGVWWLRDPAPDIGQDSQAERDAVAMRSPFGPAQSKPTKLNGAVSTDRDQLTSSGPEPDSGSVARMRELSADFSRRQDIYAKAAHADRDELDAMIAAARRSPDRESRRADLELLLVRYAEIDSKAALRTAMGLDRDTAAQIVRTLAAADPEQAWEQVTEVGNPLATTDMQAAVISAWAGQEPKRAYAQVIGLPMGWRRSELLEAVTADVARQDPQLAIELIKSVEHDKTTGLNQIVAQEWARFDPAAAARWVESVEAAGQAPLAYAISGAYVMQKPAEALAWALRISRSPGRNLWASMLGEIAHRDADEALRIALTGETAAQRSSGAGAVLGTLALRDQALAMSYLERLPPGMRADIFANVARRVAEVSPAAAFDWMDRTEDRGMRRDTAMQLVGQLVYRDVEQAAALVDRVPRESRELWIANVARAYVDLDVDKAREWVKKYQSDVKRLMPEFARALARRNPVAALEFANGIDDEKERETALARVLPAVASEDPAMAVKWTERIDDDSRRAEAVGGIVRAWSASDPPAARKWLMGMPASDARDHGLQAYLSRTESLDEVLEVVGEIRPDRRMNAVLGAAIRLKTQDPESARVLLRRYPLDPPRQAQYESSRSSDYYYGNPFDR